MATSHWRRSSAVAGRPFFTREAPEAMEAKGLEPLGLVRATRTVELTEVEEAT